VIGAGTAERMLVDRERFSRGVRIAPAEGR
jgi:hypothetical protein